MNLIMYIIVIIVVCSGASWTIVGLSRLGLRVFKRLGFKLLEYLSAAFPEALKELCNEAFFPEPEISLSDDIKFRLENSGLPVAYQVAIATTIIVILGYLFIKIFCGVLKYYLEQMVFSMRGIKFESVRQGSDIKGRNDPAYQVNVVDIGMFTTTHVGHGIRMGSYMVVPNHVRDSIKGTPGIQKNGVVVAISWVGINSNIFSDIFYAMIDNKTWSSLGVVVAPKALKLRKVQAASISSVGKGSEGIVQPQRTPGWLTYSGSTLPGYSGAAYYSTTNLIGFHTGSMIVGNVGVAASVVQRELLKLRVNESNNPEDKMDKNPFEYDDREYWYEDQNVYEWVDQQYQYDMNRLENDLYDPFEEEHEKGHVGRRAVRRQPTKATSDWANYVSANGNWADEIDFENLSLERLSQAENSLQIALSKAKAAKGLKQLKSNLAVAQNNGDKKFVPVATKTTPYTVVHRRLDLLEKTVQAHTEALNSLSSRIKPAPSTSSCEEVKESLGRKSSMESIVSLESNSGDKILCKICSRKFLKKKFLLQHIRDSHSAKPESAWPTDSKKVVKTTKEGNFLVKSSPSTSGIVSGSVLPMKENNNQFSELLESQKSTQLLLEKMLGTFNQFLTTMAGPNSEIKQN